MTMKLKFEPNQDFQLEAINAVADLFEGQRRHGRDISFKLGGIPSVPNRLDLTESDLLANLQTIQKRNFDPENLDPDYQGDPQLLFIHKSIVTAGIPSTSHFPNFSVEMETGTGKTYVYIRTALELFRRFGFRKYIIVVPSVAIREGVIKTLEITREHFRQLFDNTPYRFYAYDSKNLSQVRQFALSESVEFMVMTLAAFNKADINIIHQTTDRLQGETPVHLVQAARPILILDEPQNMESERSIRSLAALNPLFALRYSATHRNPYNIVYRLSPAEAYRRRLVKRIEVASAEQEGDTIRPYIRFVSTKAQKRTLTARLAIHKLMATGQIRESTVTVRPGDSLVDKSGGRGRLSRLRHRTKSTMVLASSVLPTHTWFKKVKRSAATKPTSSKPRFATPSRSTWSNKPSTNQWASKYFPSSSSTMLTTTHPTMASFANSSAKPSKT